VEAWVSHIPGVRIWQSAKTQLRLETALMVAADFVRKPTVRACEVTEKWSKTVDWAKSVVKDVADAVLQGDAKGVVKAVRKVRNIYVHETSILLGLLGRKVGNMYNSAYRQRV
jgi:hypothetical protein